MVGDLRYAICEFTTPDTTFEEDLRMYAAAGADGLGLIEPKLVPGGEDDQLRALKASGLQISVAIPRNVTLLPQSEEMFSGPADLDSRLGLMCDSIRRLAPFEPDTILVTTGGNDPSVSIRHARRTVAEAFRTVAKVAEECGVTLSLQPLREDLGHSMSVIQTIPETLELLEEIGADNIKIGYDIYHLWDTPGALELTKAHAKEFGFVHLSDWRPEPRSPVDRAVPGEGTINLPAFLQALDVGGYEGWYTLAIFSDDGRNGHQHEGSLWMLPPEDLLRRATDGVVSAWDARLRQPSGSAPAAAKVGAPHAGCPVRKDFDLLAPDYLEDPYPSLAEARRQSPIFYVPEFDVWFVTRYDDVRPLLRDHRTLSNEHHLRVDVPEEHRKRWPRGHSVLHSLTTMDPPQHTRIRRLVQKSFHPKEIQQMETFITSIVDDFIDGLLERSEGDLVSLFCSPLPVRVISSMLGADPADAASFKRWADEWFRLRGDANIPPDEQARLWQSASEFDDYLERIVVDRRAHPREDITSKLLHATSDEDEPMLSDSEMTAVLSGLTIGGTDTTAVLISHLLLLLLEDRTLWTRVCEDPSLIPVAIEEAMRILSPARGVLRTVLADMEIDDVSVPAGSTLYLSLASANRDETMFEEPDRFDLDRPNIKQHVGWGVGIHHCVGAPLARVEAKVAMERLTSRVPSLELTGGRPIDYVPNIIMPTVSRLEARWTA
ncbi:MAG: cytochrome P450 [Solirubrobacterales bacterium]